MRIPRIKNYSLIGEIKGAMLHSSKEKFVKFMRNNYKYYFKTSFFILLIGLFIQIRITSIVLYILTMIFTITEMAIFIEATIRGIKNYTKRKLNRER